MSSLVTAAAAALIVSGSTPALGTPPNIPDKASALSEVSALQVAPDGSMDGYSRDRFPHWIDQGGNCDTREVVLRRDGKDVQVDSSCKATSGSWTSPYDGATWTQTSDVDIDHVVPLANAWRSGASKWTDQQRRGYANDLTNPQLIAVTDNVNQAKGDQGPEAWKPPLTSYYCTYAEMWTKVKYTYKLTVNSGEKSALQDMLGTCS